MSGLAADTSASTRVRRTLGAHGWTIGVWLLFAVLLAWYADLIPRFGGFEVSSIARGALPLAFLAMAQAVIVIGGGIDLSVGSMMILANVLCARLMETQGLVTAMLIAVLVVAIGATLNGLVGWLIARTKVPDIVVTLATLFIYGGVALWILPSPGGGMPGELRYVFTGATGGIGANPWPSIGVVALAMLCMWYVMRSTNLGLSIYASGSHRQSAFLSGVDVVRSKVTSYALGGGLAAFAGLVTTAITNQGDPRFAIALDATLNSVAAVVLGGIALTGGVGSLLGAVAAGFCLFMLSPILTSLRVNPNQAQVVQGTLIVLVVMAGGWWQTRRERQT